MLLSPALEDKTDLEMMQSWILLEFFTFTKESTVFGLVLKACSGLLVKFNYFLFEHFRMQEETQSLAKRSLHFDDGIEGI